VDTFALENGGKTKQRLRIIPQKVCSFVDRDKGGDKTKVYVWNLRSRSRSCCITSAKMMTMRMTRIDVKSPEAVNRNMFGPQSEMEGKTAH